MLVKHADNEQLVDETLLPEVELVIEMKTDWRGTVILNIFFQAA
jgi:hypothetical protein